MKYAYCDCFSGISGDMFLGALVDAGLPVETLREQIALLQLPENGGDPRGTGAERRAAGLLGQKCVVGESHHHRHLSDITSVDRRQPPVRAGEADQPGHFSDPRRRRKRACTATASSTSISTKLARWILSSILSAHRCGPGNAGDRAPVFLSGAVQRRAGADRTRHAACACPSNAGDPQPGPRANGAFSGPGRAGHPNRGGHPGGPGNL